MGQPYLCICNKLNTDQRLIKRGEEEEEEEAIERGGIEGDKRRGHRHFAEYTFPSRGNIDTAENASSASANRVKKGGDLISSNRQKKDRRRTERPGHGREMAESVHK